MKKYYYALCSQYGINTLYNTENWPTVHRFDDICQRAEWIANDDDASPKKEACDSIQAYKYSARVNNKIINHISEGK